MKFQICYALLCALAFVNNPKPALASPTVHPGDTLGVEVLNYAALVDDSGGRLKSLNADNVLVAADGSISIPVVGTLNVAGKTTSAVSGLIERDLAKYIRKPIVSVRLLQQSQLLFLTGATIGTLPFLPGETLSTALGQLREQSEKDVAQVLTPGDKSGGLLSRSAIDLQRVILERDRSVGQPIDGEQILRSGSPGPTLEPGDTLRFSTKPIRVDVRGEVSAPGMVYLYPSDTLEQAVLAAGGPLSAASTADSSLLRNGKESPLPLGGSALRQAPEDGDEVIIPAAPHVTVLGQVPTPGDYTLRNGSTLLSALYAAGGPTKWANVRNIQIVHQGTRNAYDLSALTRGDLSGNMPLGDGDVVYVPEGNRIDAALFFQGIISALSGAYTVTHL